MNTRHTSSVVIAAVVSALVLASWRVSAGPPEPDLPPIPVHGPLTPDGRFVGTLTIRDVAVTDAGRLRLTGVLRGIVTQRTGATTRVKRQAFTAPAVPVDAEATTDVVLLNIAPIPLAAVGRPLTLARSLSASTPSPMRALCSRHPRPRG